MRFYATFATDKPLSATLGLASKFLEKASMTRWMGAREVLRIDVREGTVSHRELGDERGSDGDLHTLERACLITRRRCRSGRRSQLKGSKLEGHEALLRVAGHTCTACSRVHVALCVSVANHCRCSALCVGCADRTPRGSFGRRLPFTGTISGTFDGRVAY